MSSMGKNNKDTSSYMNNRIPKKKSKASSSLTNSSGAQSTADIQSSTNAVQSSQPIYYHNVYQEKAKMINNQMTRKGLMILGHFYCTKTRAPKKVKANSNDTTSGRDDNNIAPPVTNVPTYQVVKEGRVSGYPIIVSQVGSEHDAILLGCKDNPQEYLNNNKDGKVKIRWKFAGYNGLVPTHTVRLIELVDGAPPIRKAAVLSGLLETDELVANKDDDIDLGEEEDDDAPILKVVRTDLLDSTSRADKDGEYNDQEDRDEKLVCYERSASVGYTGGKTSLAAASTDGNGIGISLSTNQDGADNEEDRASANQDSEDNNAAESSLTFEPPTDESDTNSHKPPAVTSNFGIKAEDTDADSVATDPMDNEEVVPMEVKSDINVKSSHKPSPSVVRSQPDIIKSEDGDVDSVATDSMINVNALSLLAAYGDDTDNVEPKPLKVTSDMNMNIKADPGEETDDDELKSSAVVSDINAKAEEEVECSTSPRLLSDVEIVKRLEFVVIDKFMKKTPKRGISATYKDCRLLLGTREIVCSTCNISKRNDCFTPRQQVSKRIHKFCRECIEGGALEKLNEQLERLTERQCVGCTLTKKKEEFKENQISKGLNAYCMKCFEMLIRNRKELEKMLSTGPADEDDEFTKQKKKEEREDIRKKERELLEMKMAGERVCSACKELKLPKSICRLCVEKSQRTMTLSWRQEKIEKAKKGNFGSDSLLIFGFEHTCTVCNVSKQLLGDYNKKERKKISGYHYKLSIGRKDVPVYNGTCKECINEISMSMNNLPNPDAATNGIGISLSTNQDEEVGRDLKRQQLVLVREEVHKNRQEERKRKQDLSRKELEERKKEIGVESVYSISKDHRNEFFKKQRAKVDALHKKTGDNLSCGNVDSIIMNNINKLPSLKVGVTHSKGGPMEDLLKQYPVDKVRKEHEQMQRIARETIVLGFFEKLNLFIENEADYDLLEKMIKSYPYLLKAKCPHEIREVGAGCTAMEAICSCQSRADTCEFLEELVRLGGQATDECYEGLDWSYVMPLEELQVLLVSGYIPKKLEKDERFFLDVLANGLDVDEEDDDVYEEDKFWFLSILYKLVKLGDWLRFGETRSQVFVNNINKLPPLEIGVTHQKGGPLDKLITRFPVETVIEFNKQNRAQKEAYKKEQEIKRKKQEEDCKRKAQVMEQRKKEEEMQRLAREEESKKRREERKKIVELKRKEQGQCQKKKVPSTTSTTTRTCSVCQVTKSTTEFSKNQRGKGDAAKCKGCIVLMQQGLKGKAKAKAEPKQGHQMKKETISMSVGDNAVLASEAVKKPMSSNTQEKPKKQNESKLSWRQMYLSGSRA